MNKTELIDAVATSADLPKAAAGGPLDAVVECISKALKEGDQVSLTDLVHLLSRSAQLAQAAIQNQ